MTTVVERPSTALRYPNLTILRSPVVGLDPDAKVVFLASPSGAHSRVAGSDVGAVAAADGLGYDQLCVCTGAAPRPAIDLLHQGTPVTHSLKGKQKVLTHGTSGVEGEEGSDSSAALRSSDAFAKEVMVTVRDIDSVDLLRAKLASARRVLLVGNGGIAMEIVGALCGGTREGMHRRHAPGDGRGSGDERAGAGATTAPPELVWAVRHATIGDAFFDRDAASFLLGLLMQEASSPSEAPPKEEVLGKGGDDRVRRRDPGLSRMGHIKEGQDSDEKDDANEPMAKKRRHATTAATTAGDEQEEDKSESDRSDAINGSAAGPDWLRRLIGRSTISSSDGGRGIHYTSNVGPRSNTPFVTSTPYMGVGAVAFEDHEDTAMDPFRLRLLTECELAALEPGDVGDDGTPWPAVAVLSDGTRLGVDLVVSAAGVDPAPCIDWLSADVFPRGADGGIAVDACQRAIGGGGSVFAAGDAASSCRSDDPSHHWFQMRLWGQARASGTYTARVMVGEADELALGFNFELFTHTTSFFGQKVILLGLYNGQKLEKEPEADVVMYTRSEYQPAPVFIRVLLLRGKMMGAVLIGDTGLEETFENLILDGVDLSRYGAEILDPDVDIEDYFD